MADNWPNHSNNQVATWIHDANGQGGRFDVWSDIVKAAGYPDEKCWSVSTIERALGQQKENNSK